MKHSLFLLVLTACMAICRSVQAAPRDAVMSQAFGCAAVGDSRQWLDCYYGAAQPMRASLGMPPAPAAQVRLAMSPPTGTPANVDVRNTVVNGAFRCNDLTNDRQWLDCYYGAAQPMRSLLGLSPASQANIRSAGTVPRQTSGTPPSQFGLPPPEKGLPDNADHVVSRMASFAFDRHGIFTVTLENGQVWYQIAGDTNNAHWNKPARSYVVNISRGWFGSFNFQVKGEAAVFKVRRQT